MDGGGDGELHAPGLRVDAGNDRAALTFDRVARVPENEEVPAAAAAMRMRRDRRMLRAQHLKRCQAIDFVVSGGSVHVERPDAGALRDYQPIAAAILSLPTLYLTEVGCGRLNVSPKTAGPVRPNRRNAPSEQRHTLQVAVQGCADYAGGHTCISTNLPHSCNAAWTTCTEHGSAMRFIAS
jgi:hypothetical protein